MWSQINLDPVLSHKCCATWPQTFLEVFCSCSNSTQRWTIVVCQSVLRMHGPQHNPNACFAAAAVAKFDELSAQCRPLQAMLPLRAKRLQPKCGLRTRSQFWSIWWQEGALNEVLKPPLVVVTETPTSSHKSPSTLPQKRPPSCPCFRKKRDSWGSRDLNCLSCSCLPEFIRVQCFYPLMDNNDPNWVKYKTQLTQPQF